MQSTSSPIIGYSAYDTSEQVYEYNANSCFIADSPETLRAFTKQCWQPAEFYRAAAVRLADMVRDFGASCGRYAMEPEALKRFRQAADECGLDYAIVPDDGYGSSDLTQVEIAYRSLTPDID